MVFPWVESNIALMFCLASASVKEPDGYVTLTVAITEPETMERMLTSDVGTFPAAATVVIISVENWLAVVALEVRIE